MKNKKAIVIISAIFLVLVLLVSLAASLCARQIKQKEKVRAAKQYQSVPVNKEITKQDNYSLVCKLINANEQTMGYRDDGSQALASKFIKDYMGEFEIKVENGKAVMWEEDYQVINNNGAYLTLYRYDRGGTADNSRTVSIDKSSGNGFFTWTEMFLAENTMTSAVISCREK